jgi:hypothetical protein
VLLWLLLFYLIVTSADDFCLTKVFLLLYDHFLHEATTLLDDTGIMNSTAGSFVACSKW